MGEAVLTLNSQGLLRVVRGAVALAVVAVALTACKTIRPYEKEYLLGPLMDDAALPALDARFARDGLQRFERLAGTGGGSAGSACPTCGG